MNRLNVVHICDHLGWEGSRMHGVKRLFAWMIPRFDKSRFNVSLISLRKKDLSADTLEEFGIDVTTWRGTSSILDVPERQGPAAKNADCPLHGYGATTFGRLCAWRWEFHRSCTSMPITATRRGSRRSPTASWRRIPIWRSRSRNQPLSSRFVRA